MPRLFYSCLTWLGVALPAHAVTPGETIVLINWQGTVTVWSQSITYDNSRLWIAMEISASVDDSLRALYLFKYNMNTENVDAVYLQDFDELDGHAMFPSIVTWPGANDVVVVAPENYVNPPEVHLRVYTQDRSDFEQLADDEPVIGINDGFNHSKPFVSRDPVEPEQFLCWTRKSSTNSGVRSKPKDESTWFDSSAWPIADTADEEDHCHNAFDVDGARYAVYHTKETALDIFVLISTWDGSSWDEPAEFPLTGSATANFPTIWTTASNTVPPVTHIAIAAQSGANDILFWDCVGGSISVCDSASDFGSAVTLSSGSDSYSDPKVLVVPRVSGGQTHFDRFIFYQRTNDIPRVRIAAMCAGETAFTDVGILPLDTQIYDDETIMHLGRGTSSALPSIAWDGSEFWVPILVQNPGNDDTFDPAVYHHAPPEDFCS